MLLAVKWMVADTLLNRQAGGTTAAAAALGIGVVAVLVGVGWSIRRRMAGRRALRAFSVIVGVWGGVGGGRCRVRRRRRPAGSATRGWPSRSPCPCCGPCRPRSSSSPGSADSWRTCGTSGLGLFAVTLLKVVAVDLAGVGAGYRILSFLGLGGLLLATSVLYGRLGGASPAIGGVIGPRRGATVDLGVSLPIKRTAQPAVPPKPARPPVPPVVAVPPAGEMKPATVGRATDEDLMRRTQSGDKLAFSLLYERYSASVLSYLYRMLGNADDVESVGQEVFLRAFRFAPTYRYPQKFSTWLFTITRNLAINQSRRKRRSPVRSVTELNLEGVEVSGDAGRVAAAATDDVEKRGADRAGAAGPGRPADRPERGDRPRRLPGPELRRDGGHHRYQGRHPPVTNVPRPSPARSVDESPRGRGVIATGRSRMGSDKALAWSTVPPA